MENASTEKVALKNSTKRRLKPSLIKHQRVVLDLVQATSSKAVLQLGAALPHEEFFPGRALQRIATRLARTHDPGFIRYEVPPGLASLREALAHRMSGFGCDVNAADILITSGCQEAIAIALKCVTEPRRRRITGVAHLLWLTADDRYARPARYRNSVSPRHRG